MAWQLLGYDRLVDLLGRGLRAGRLAHAYLIVGPRHAGKMTLATGMAQAVNCQGAEPPCGECEQCRRVASGKHADVRVISPATSDALGGRVRSETGVRDIHELQRQASLPPYEGRYKVFILDEAERLSSEAANRLLKILEEPPRRVLLLLSSAAESALLPTIVSRCQRLEICPLPLGTVSALLARNRGLEPARAELLARLSGGCLGWALAALEDDSILELRRQNILVLAEVVDQGYEERLALAGQWARRFERAREDIVDLLDLWSSWWRDILLVKMGCPESVTATDFRSELEAQAAGLEAGEILGSLASVRRAVEYLASNANPRLALEVLMLNMPGRGPARRLAPAAGG